MKELVTGHPYTTESILQNDTDEFLILACDGVSSPPSPGSDNVITFLYEQVWDVCSDQEAVDLICNVYDPQEASKILVDHALSRFSTDNLSCMIVRLDPSGKFENIQTSPAKTSNGFEDNGKIMSEVDEHQHIGPHQGFGVTKDITLKLPPAIKEKADKAA
jgi:protein phosphatase PTC1